MQTNTHPEPERQARAHETARLEALEQLLMQRALGHSEQPRLAARTLGEIESRALARQYLARRGALARVLTPRERTTFSAVAAGTSREASGALLAVLHLVSAPGWRIAGAALIGAALGYAFASSAQGLLAQLPLHTTGPQAPLQAALGLGALGALAGALAAQGARVRAYMY